MSSDSSGTQTARKRWYRRIPWWGWVTVVVVAVIAAAAGGGGGGGKPTADTTSTPPAASAPASPSEEPTGDTSTEPTPLVTDAEVVAAFQAYIDERAGTGVVIAKAVTDVSFTDRVVRVTFDPAAAGIDQATFDQINPFDNLAEFAGSPIAFNDDLGKRLRPAVDAVETLRADGTPLGTMTTEDIYKMGTGEDL